MYNDKATDTKFIHATILVIEGIPTVAYIQYYLSKVVIQP